MRFILLLLIPVAAYFIFQFSRPPVDDVVRTKAIETAAERAAPSPESPDETAGTAGSLNVHQDRVAVEPVATNAPSISTGSKEPKASGTAAVLGDSRKTLVRFRFEGSSSQGTDAGQFSVNWLGVSTPEISGQLKLSGDGECAASLPVGTYRCTCKSASGLTGPVIEFTVDTEPVTVDLIAPAAFELRAIVQSNETDALLSGVTVAMERSDLVGLGDPTAREVVTDTTGTIQFEDLSPGEWSFSLILGGYAESRFTITLPGRWLEQINDVGHVDFGALKMAPITPLEVRLLGHSDWANLTQGFRVAADADGEPSPFDALGHTTVELGWISNPVFLKLYYPNEQRLGLYLDAGLPEAGEAIEIEVGRGRTLEIDVRASAEIRDLVDFGKSSFNVTGRTARGDSVTQGASVDGIGIYRVEGVAANRVTVSFSTVMDGRLTVMTSESVAMKDSGVTTCTLLIDSVPRRLVLKGMSWQPGTSTFAEVRPSPDQTSWLHGNPVDEEGSILLPDLRGNPHSLRLLDPDQRVLAIDLPIILPETDQPAEMVIRSPKTTRTRVLLDGKPTGGIPVSYTGAASIAVCAVEETRDDGWTPSWEIVEGSRLLVQPLAKGFWGAESPKAHEGGDLVIALHSTGTIQLPSAVDPDDVRSQRAGVTLGDWVRESLVTNTSGDPLLQEYSVPIGQYSVHGADGSALTVEVTRATLTAVTF